MELQNGQLVHHQQPSGQIWKDHHYVLLHDSVMLHCSVYMLHPKLFTLGIYSLRIEIMVLTT